jgi:adenylyltransferase/sulfurtransferase
VLPTAPATVAALQATAALRLLLGHPPCAELLHLDLWRDCWDRIPVARDPACPCCGARRFDFLEARATAWVSTLCGRNAVQIAPPPGAPRLDLERLRASLAAVAPVRDNGLLVAFSVEGCELVVFPDGRALVRGTTEEAVAKRLYTRYIGS